VFVRRRLFPAVSNDYDATDRYYSKEKYFGSGSYT
jgi:hypothetical protein